jgi:hypothetical protein
MTYKIFSIKKKFKLKNLKNLNLDDLKWGIGSYEIYVHCWKIYNLFVWAIKTCTQTKAKENKCYSYQQCTYIVFILQKSKLYWKVQKQSSFQLFSRMSSFMSVLKFNSPFFPLYKDHIHNINLNTVWIRMLQHCITKWNSSSWSYPQKSSTNKTLI